MNPRESANSTSNLLVLSKITRILDTFSLSRPELTLPEIRSATGLPASTAQRLVANLVSNGFLSKTDGGFRMGLRMAYWAAPATHGLDPVHIVSPELSALRDLTEETVALFRPSLTFRVCVALAETHHIVRRHMRVGQILPLHAGSAGRVILAWRDDLLRAVADSELDPITSETITRTDQLRTAVARTRSEGFAVTSNERETGASGISAPVFDAQGQLTGALSLMGPATRLTRERLDELVPTVVEVAERLTRMLGGRHPREE